MEKKTLFLKREEVAEIQKTSTLIVDGKEVNILRIIVGTGVRKFTVWRRHLSGMQGAIVESTHLARFGVRFASNDLDRGTNPGTFMKNIGK